MDETGVEVISLETSLEDSDSSGVLNFGLRADSGVVGVSRPGIEDFGLAGSDTNPDASS